jgi:F420-non-reducing hydrogenase large subunit
LPAQFSEEIGVSKTKQRISIDPITRLEGHARIEIFLDNEGQVADAFLQVPELRGFEQFCLGRNGEDLPQITERICGVCPEAHHLASAKALDACYKVQPTSRARALRELLYNAYIFSDHLLHVFYLGGPDLIVGYDAPPEKRNILGVIAQVGLELGREVIRHRSYGQRIIEMLGGRSIHPVTALPGGQSKGLNKDEVEEIRPMAESCLTFAQQTLAIFQDLIQADGAYRKLLKDRSQAPQTYYMGLVSSEGQLNFYDGLTRIVAPDGSEYALVEAQVLPGLLEEHVEPWTYVKIPYLREVGWQGFTAGADSGIYRVGPLARLNVCQSIQTPLGQTALEAYREFFGSKVIHATFAFHWARVIEMLAAAESVLLTLDDPNLVKGPLRTPLGEPGEGVGVIEAARGTLIHHYKLDERGLVTFLNLIVATTHNAAGLSMSVRDMAKKVIKRGEVDQGKLNLVEMSFRNYDPCIACATHAFPGEMPIQIILRDQEGRELQRIERG